VVDKTEALIQDLAKQSQAKKILMSTSSVMALYCLIALILILISYLTAPVQAKITFFQLISTVLGLFAAYYAALTAIASSVPGEAKFHYPLATVAYLLLWLLFDEVLQRAFVSPELVNAGINCVQHVLLLAITPTLVLMVLVFNRAPLRSGLTAFFAVCSAGIVANICMRLCCGADTVSHDLFFHITPCAILVGGIVMFSRRYLSWETRLRKIKPL
jgi:hypothetical protein